MAHPETRSSLILRIRNRDDREGWDEFERIYRPVIRRMARIKGMQEADADDLSQQVLLSISKAIQRWTPDQDRAKFRNWLGRIAQNAIINAISRVVPDRATGRDEMRISLELRQAQSGPDSDLLRTEYRREVFHLAANEIRGEFSDETWQSFWLTAVEGKEVDVAATELGRSRGSVYASRSRVMKRLKQKVEEFDEPNL